MADEQPVEDIGGQRAIHINLVAWRPSQEASLKSGNAFVPNFSVTKSIRHRLLPMKVWKVPPGIAPPLWGIGFDGKTVA
jgi:hypothetical protein